MLIRRASGGGEILGDREEDDLDMVDPSTPGGFVVLTSLYNETDPRRVTEYLESISRNLWNDSIDEIVVFYDTSRDGGSSLIREYLDTVPVRIEAIESRPTFAMFFSFANRQYRERRVIVCNADIYFDRSLTLLDDYDLSGRFLCLTRWEALEKGELNFAAWNFSQDVWIFQAPLREFPADIPLGVLGCDNRVAWEAENSGLIVLNPSRSIRSYHVHSSGVHSPSRNVRIEGPYKSSIPSELYPDIPQRSDGAIFLPAFAASIHGSYIRYESFGRNLGYWIDHNDWISWQFRVHSPGTMVIELTYAADRDSGGSTVVVAVDGQEIQGVVEETGSTLR